MTFDGRGSTDDGSIQFYNWDFGDNTTSTVSNGLKTYTTAGTYTLRLTVTDDTGLTSSTTQTITVNGIAVAVSPPACLGVAIAENYTAINNITLYDTNWAVTATAADPLTSATATVTQGVRIRLPTNFCP